METPTQPSSVLLRLTGAGARGSRAHRNLKTGIPVLSTAGAVVPMVTNGSGRQLTRAQLTSQAADMLEPKGQLLACRIFMGSSTPALVTGARLRPQATLQ